MNPKLSEETRGKIHAAADDLLQKWNASHSAIPFRLYHYTSADGLIGIMKTSSFFMTDLKYMNDLSELQYGTQVVDAVLNQKKEEYSSSPAVLEFMKRLTPTATSSSDGLSIYSTSFCENGNLLSQWRAYGDRGGGYAIGIDIFRSMPFFSRLCTLRRVIYERSIQESFVSEFTERFCRFIADETRDKPLDDSVLNYLIPNVCLVFSQLLTEYIICFKHPDFAEEREWRLVFAFQFDDPRNLAKREMQRLDHEKEIQFRSYSGNVIPYVVNNFANAIGASQDDSYCTPFPVVELVIGPTINPELNQRSITALLRKLAPDITPVVLRSGIPLRWL